MAAPSPSNSTHGPPGGQGAQGGHGGQGGGGGEHGGAARAAMFAKRLALNKRYMRIYAAALCGLIAIFVITHWVRLVVNRTRRSSKSQNPPKLTAPFAYVSRAARSVLIRKFPGFSSNGHALLVAAYVAINAALTFTGVDTSSGGSLGNRFGWMLSANFVVVVFLALKNTPLAILTAYSYERLNVLHQVSGYATIIYLVLHGCVYADFFGESHKLYILRTEEQICGIVAGFGFLGVFISAAFIRRYWYEAFYITHIISFLVALICGALHQPELAKGILIMMLIIASMWVSDRLIRALRVLYYSTNNQATVHPLPNGGTRIVMAKKPRNAVPGKHCFVWIPKIRLFEMHPFTVVATEPMEFIINSYDGFTGDLHRYALDQPGSSLKTSIDGPYGTFPDPMEYDKIILIAGGSGASFTFGLAVNLLERMGPESTKNIVFIWAVKKHDNLTWFTDHLTTLRTHNHSPKVTVSLFVTRAPASPMSDEQRRGSVLVRGAIHRPDEVSLSSEHQVTPISPIRDLEKALMNLPPRAHLRDDDKQHIEESETHHDEKHIEETEAQHDGSPEHDHEHDQDHHHEHQRRSHNRPANGVISTATSNDSLALAHRVTPGRPDTATLIREELSRTPRYHRVLVAACGPDGLMRVVRKTAAGCIRGDGPEVELHCEQFGW